MSLVKPFDSKSYKRLQFVNEIGTYVCSVFISLFSRFVSDVQSRWIFGYVFIALIYICITVNMAMVAWFGYKTIKDYIENKKLKQKVQLQKYMFNAPHEVNANRYFGDKLIAREADIKD